jgi:hypothetical protein
MAVFLAGTAGSVAVGAAAFRAEAFSPGHPFFQCVYIGALMAGVLALIRSGMTGRAVTVAVTYSVFQLGIAWSVGWSRALSTTVWSLVMCTGIVLLALIYDLLARGGFRLGKFVLMGPLLGGIYVAATPITLIEGVSLVAPQHSMTTLLLNCFLGIVIGDGVGLGAEVAELIADRGSTRAG